MRMLIVEYGQPILFSAFLVTATVYVLWTKPRHRTAPAWMNAVLSLTASGAGIAELFIDESGLLLAVPVALVAFALSIAMAVRAHRQLFGPRALSSRAEKSSSDLASRS